MAEGYISLYRSLLDNWLWEEDRILSRAEAWIDILLMVNFAEGTHKIGDEVLPVHPGSRYITVRELCQRWKWSNTKVTKFMRLLEKDRMIVQNNDKKKTLITVVNWAKYQVPDDKKTSEKRQKNVKEKTLNNNVNNDNKEISTNTLFPDEEIGAAAIETPSPIPFKEIIDYLNEKADTTFKPTGKTTREHIQARWNEKFTLQDFFTVIDKKTAQWKGTESEIYLRPITLFGTKFESYLNQKGGPANGYPNVSGGSPRLQYKEEDREDPDKQRGW